MMRSKIITTVKNAFKSWHNLDERKAVSAGAIILQEVDGELKIALAQRKNKNKTWVLPKGHVEAGESIEQAALREVYEETGLRRVQLITYLGVVSREAAKSNGNVVRKTIHYYLAYALQNNKEQAPPDTAFAKPGWFSPPEAMRLLPYEEERAFFSKQLEALL